MVQTLRQLHRSIPLFAEWNIPDLVDIFAAYREILGEACHNDFGECGTLRNNTTLIESCIRDCMEKGSATAYGRAASELAMDIETLIRLIS